MNLSPYELALIAGGFTIMGVLIGGWIAYRNALNIYKISEFDKAASVLRNAFLPETTYLKYNANIGGLSHATNLHDKLRNNYLRHLKALEIFKTRLLTAEREAIDRVWNEYCHPNGTPEHPDEKRDFIFNDYMSIEETKGEEEAKKVALQKIVKILEFATVKKKHCYSFHLF